MLFLNKYVLSNIHTLKDSSESNIGLGIEKPAFQLSDDLLNLLNQLRSLIRCVLRVCFWVCWFFVIHRVVFHKVILHIKTEVYYKYSVVLAYMKKLWPHQ